MDALEVPVSHQVPIVKFFSPNKSDQGLIEFWDTTQLSYLPLDLGAPHPSTREYPNFKLGKQFNLPTDEKTVVRIWVKDQPSPEFWNWSEKFVSESNSHPIFIRTYREPRNSYAPLTKGQPLTAVYKLTLTAAGGGYTPGTLPALTFSGGGGTGAIGHAVVNQDGTIAELVLDNGGVDYTSAPTFTVAAPPSGTRATGTASIQPVAAVLISEEAQEFPDDSEFFGLYLSVVRVYQTLPGPDLTTQSIGQDNLTPPKYRRLITHRITETDVSSALAFPGSLAGDQVLVEQAMQTVAIARKKIVEEIIALDEDPLVGSRATEERQTATVTESIVLDTDPPPTLSELVIAATKDPIGNGKSIQIVVTVDEVFDGRSRQIGTPNVIPERFRAATGLNSREDTVAGTVPDTVSLSPGEIERGETQQTVFTKRVRTTSFDPEGTPTLHGQDVDRKLGVPLPYTEYLSADPESEIGNAAKEVTPLSDTVALVKQSDSSALAAALDSIVLDFPGSTSLGSLGLPAVLTGIDAIVTASHAEGSYSESTAWNGNHFVAFRIDSGESSGRAQGSASIVVEIVPYVKHPPQGRISTRQFLFFMPLPVTTADIVARLETLTGESVTAFPAFAPSEATVVVTGEAVALEVSTKSRYSSSNIVGERFEFNATRGAGKSIDKRLTSHATQIGPTIHGAVSVNVIGDLTETVSVTSSSEVAPNADEPISVDQSESASVAATISASIGATSVTEIPSGSGLLIFSTTAEPYAAAVDSMGAVVRYAMIHAETINAADIPS